MGEKYIWLVCEELFRDNATESSNRKYSTTELRYFSTSSEKPFCMLINLKRRNHCVKLVHVYDFKYKLYILLRLTFTLYRRSVAGFLLFFRKVSHIYSMISHLCQLQNKKVFLRRRVHTYIYFLIKPNIWAFFHVSHRNNSDKNYACFYILNNGSGWRFWFVKLQIYLMKSRPILVLNSS